MNAPVTVQQPPVEKRKVYQTLGVVAFAHAVTHMFSALMPIIYPLAMQQFGFSYAELGFMVGLGNTLMSLLQGIYGFLSRWVMRRVILGISHILLAVSTFLMMFTGSFAPFFTLNILSRVSTSPQHPMGNSLVAQNYGRKLRGTAFGLNFAGGNLGTVLVPALGTMSVTAFGWRWTMGVFSVLPLVAALLCLTMIPEYKKAGQGVAIEKGGINPGGGKILYFLKDRNILGVVLAGSLAAGGRGIGVVMTYVPLYLKQGLYLDAVSYASLFTIMMMASVVGPPLAGRLSDSFGRKRTAMMTCILSFFAVMAFSFAGKNMLQLVPATIFVGLVAYSQGSQIQALVSDVTSSETRDMAYSLFFTVSYLAGGVWSYVLGLVTDKFGFGGAFGAMSLSYLAALSALIPLSVGKN